LLDLPIEAMDDAEIVVGPVGALFDGNGVDVGVVDCVGVGVVVTGAAVHDNGFIVLQEVERSTEKLVRMASLCS
jgi:hypothetical protein